MKIVIATPLYPPDIADPAPYVKELAQQLRGGAEVEVVTYGYIPEAVDDTSIRAISKRLPAVVRGLRFAAVLWQSLGTADFLYIQSGTSVEVPTYVVLLLRPRTTLFRIGNDTTHGAIRCWVRAALSKRSTIVVPDPALARPEILPLEQYPTEKFEAYKQAWATHLTAILTTRV